MENKVHVKQPYDSLNNEERNRIVQGAYLTEGTMVAFPTCFPGCSAPLPADESRITALALGSNNLVYAGTSGRAVHLLVGMFHGASGAVMDLGLVRFGFETTAICCGEKRVVAAVNGPDGGRLVSFRQKDLPFDLLQEFHFSRNHLEEIGQVFCGEKIIHMVNHPGSNDMVGTTEGHIFRFSLSDYSIEIIDEFTTCGKLGLTAEGNIIGCDTGGNLWKYDILSRSLQRRAVSLPACGNWKTGTPVFSRGAMSEGVLYVADSEGRIFSFTEKDGFSDELCKTVAGPIYTMATTFDGRLFGSFGEGIGRMFRYCPVKKHYADLGVAISVFERRRYGYCFADSMAGRDGQIIWAENDDLGHIWLYYPRIQRPSTHNHG